MKFATNLLDASYKRENFDCSNSILNRYLYSYALQDMKRQLCRVYVLSNQEKEVIGFYSLSAMSFSFESLPENLQHRLPHYPVPAVLIGRLAVTKSIQNQGFGCRLLMDALTRILLANQSVGIYSALVDAKDNNAKSFYEKYGFIAFKDNPFKLFLPLKTLQDSIIL